MKITDITESQLIEALPHGSGIDCSWQFEFWGMESWENNRKRIVCENSFHLMDEHGFYGGWQDFRVVIFECRTDKFNPLRGPMEGKAQVLQRKGDIDFRVEFPGGLSRKNLAYGLRDYLEETIHYSLSECGILTNRNETIELS